MNKPHSTKHFQAACMKTATVEAHLWNSKKKAKGGYRCLQLIHDSSSMTAHVLHTTFPLAKWAPVQSATIDPNLDLCPRHPLWLGGSRQCGIKSLPETCTHGQCWESNPRPSDLVSNALTCSLKKRYLLQLRVHAVFQGLSEIRAGPAGIRVPGATLGWLIGNITCWQDLNKKHLGTKKTQTFHI